MTYKGMEEHNYMSAPIELYEFEVSGAFYRFTSSKSSYTNLSDQTFLPVLVRRTAIRKTGNLDRAMLKVDIELTNEIAEMFKVNTPSIDIALRVYRTHEGAGEEICIYSGFVTGCDFESNRATLSVEPLVGLLNDNAVTKTYKTICNHNVYDEGCALNKADYERVVTVSAIGSNGLVLTLSGLNEAAGYYEDGLAEFGNTYRHISMHDDVEGTITLISPFEDLAVGDQLKIYKGCSRTITACNDFNNFDRFFGFPLIPTKNIFESGL